MGFKKFFKKAVSPVLKFLGVNPLVALGVSLFISWALRPKTPEIEDFGTNSFDDFEKGLLINKQSNDSNIPVVYGERLVGGTRVFMETSGTDNTYLYMAIVMAEGEINDIEEILVDDKVVTWASALSDGTEVEVNSSDTNFYKDSTSLIRIEPHYGTDGQSASTLLSTLTNWEVIINYLVFVILQLDLNGIKTHLQEFRKVQAKVQGKKVVAYNSSLVAQTAAYSTNPAWCLLDYLTNDYIWKRINS
jgi:hypothetical protein